MKPETIFRNRKVLPFIKKLENFSWIGIQQRTKVGDPDYVLNGNGWFIAMELKASEDEKPRPLQHEKLKWHASKGALSLTVYPENWEDVKALLTKINKGAHNVYFDARKIIGPDVLSISREVGERTGH